MSHSSLTRQLARIRGVERRIAAASVSRIVKQVADSEARVVRLNELSQAIAPCPGSLSGDALASGGECVARLLAGSIATSIQRGRLDAEVELARKAFAVADVRAEIANLNVKTAARAEVKAADLRAALKRPTQGVLQCR